METATTEEEREPTDRECWLEARQTGLGGTDAATCLGVNPYQSQFELYSLKLGLIEPRESTPAMEWGRRLEQAVLDWYAEETEREVDFPPDLESIGVYEYAGWACRRAGYQLLRSRQYKWMIGTPDELIHDRKRGWGVLEIKTSRSKDAWKDGPPPHVLAQVQHYLALTGLQWGAVAVLFSGNDAGHMDIERDEEFITRMIEAEREFWRRIVERDPPEPDDSESTDRALRALYSKGSGEEIDLPDAADEIVAHYLDTKRQADEFAKLKRAYETQLRGIMGSASVGRLPSGAVVKRVDVSATRVEDFQRKASSYLRVTPPR